MITLPLRTAVDVLLVTAMVYPEPEPVTETQLGRLATSVVPLTLDKVTPALCAPYPKDILLGEAVNGFGAGVGVFCATLCVTLTVFVSLPALKTILPCLTLPLEFFVMDSVKTVT